MISLSKIRSLADWPKLRVEIETAVQSVLGELPKEAPELQVKVLDEESFDLYTRKRVNFFVDEWERISAWLFVPEGKEDAPAILCCHRSAPEGKNESAGLSGDPALAFARHYAEQGYVTIAPDCITAGERISAGLKPYDTSRFYKDYPKMSAIGKMMADHMRAIDVLCETKRVDPGRIGVIGHSLGGHNALFLAAFEERVQACVASCAFTRFADDDEPARWARSELFSCLPAMRAALENRETAFDWEHILALAAPTPIQLITALNDERFPHTESCAKAVAAAQKVYKQLGKPNAIDNYEHHDGHGMNVLLQEVADEWFERWL